MTMTVPGVARFTLHGSWTNGREWASVLDYQIDTTGSALDRGDEIQVQAQTIMHEFQDLILPNLVNNVSVEGISFVDLDDEDGVTGSQGTDPTEATIGGQASASATPNVSFLVHKQIVGSRNTRRGRWYIPGVQEASVDEDGALSGSGVVDLQADLRTFLTNTNREEGVTSVSNMCVVHLEPRPTPPADDNRVGTFSLVNDLFLDPMVATQRRRLRR